MNRRRDINRDLSSSAGKVPRWIITYSDLVTLLFSFFVVLVSFSTFERGKLVQLVGTFVSGFGIIERGFKTDSGEEVLAPGKTMVKADASKELLASMKGIFSQPGTGGAVEYKVTREGLRVSIADYLLFGLDEGKAEISPEMEQFLDEVAGILSRETCLIQIEGHTDDRSPASRQYPSSWELSTARAVAVLKYLTGKGISPLRLSAAGYGQYRPLSSNETAEGRAKNRRVVLSFLKNELQDDRDAQAPLFNEGVVKNF